MMTMEIDGAELAVVDFDALVEVRAEEATDEADALTVVATVTPDAAGEWPSMLDPLLTPRTPIVMEIARGGVSYRFDGYSAQAFWELDAEGQSRLTVKAVDRSLDLDAAERVVTWSGQRESAIAQTIFERHDLRAEVEQTPPAPDPDVHVLLQRASDWAFVRTLAARWGYAVYLEAGPLGVTGHFHAIDPLADPQGELALGHGGDAYRAQVRVELLAGQRIKATRLPPLAAVPVAGQAAGDDEAQGARSLAGQLTTLLAPADLTGEIDPQLAATAVARKSAYAVTLTCSYDTERTDLLLRARRPVLVRGLGTALSGRYLVDRVRHVLTLDGHQQEVTLKRNALGLTGDEPYGREGLL